jgi:hypothetical protein
VGYYFAYRGIYSVEGGPGLGRREMIAVVTAGFGGFLAHGGGALDQYALQAAGPDKRDASVRVTALAGLEHGILGYVGSGAAIAVLALGLPAPPADFSVPWAVIPVPATAAGAELVAADAVRAGQPEAAARDGGRTRTARRGHRDRRRGAVATASPPRMTRPASPLDCAAGWLGFGGLSRSSCTSQHDP